jgi:hypothetical protein
VPKALRRPGAVPHPGGTVRCDLTDHRSVTVAPVPGRQFQDAAPVGASQVVLVRERQ